ncbi:carbohydrate-binding protein [Amycolatopsis sp. cg9]|uniref:carbohydrate-binding protein n=1 Tax=Amycolatopsis sp. cg9 TaxID=3238801 RepID=UPI0035242F8D
MSSYAALAATAALIAATAAPAAAATQRVEAEAATCSGTVDSNWSGYSGAGFCNGDNAVGAYVQFSTGGAESAVVRFANGTTSARAADVLVDGVKTQSLSFPATGSWSTWASQTIPLTANSSTVRLSPTTAGGLPNIDYAEFTTGGTQAGTTLYAAPNGKDSAEGTLADPLTLPAAIAKIGAGGTISLRGGTYSYSQTVTIPPANSGTSSSRKTLSAYAGETPVLNFSAMAEDPANRGLALNGSYWRVAGLVVERAGDNGIFVGGSNNVVERVVTRFNRDSGLQISRIASDTPQAQWPSNNLVVSSESHDNADSDGEDADGFASKLTSGTGNVFRYDVSHHNIDDGWDLYTKTDTGPIGPVTIEDSLAYANGTLSNGTVNENGDRNGFKLGGDKIAVDHVVRRDIAYRNGHHGFTYNSNPGSMTVSDNVGIDNAERNFSFDTGTSVFRANTSCRFAVDGSNDKTVGNADSSNQFWTGTNGSRCSSYGGTLRWSFASDGRLVVTFG